MGTPVCRVRELCVLVLQLCHYVEDMKAVPSLTELSVLNEKGKQIKQMVNELYGGK